MNNILLFILLSFMIMSCDKSPSGYKYNAGDLPDTPVNLSDFNTEYDDYNSTAPSLGSLIPFCFSTNRNSSGGEFDIIYQPMNVNFDKTTGDLTVTNQYDNWSVFMDEYEVIKKSLTKTNTSGNEFGPYLIEEMDFNDYQFTLLSASDNTGNFQINYTSNISDPEFSAIQEVGFLNSTSDDLYPAFTADRSKIYFCSNRDGDDFDFYYTSILQPNTSLEVILSDTTYHEVFKESVISSDADDKCPFIYYHVLVFSSNRPGGFGGFDLYYSILEDTEWSTPVNFGSDINSEADEYRPILIDEGVSHSETMMVFSSNREGGKGGFDLYFVGVNVGQQVIVD